RDGVSQLPPHGEALPHHHRVAHGLFSAARAAGAAVEARSGERVELWRGEADGSLVEGNPRYVLVHGMRTLPDALPDVRHGEAADAQRSEPCDPAPRAAGRGDDAAAARCA